MIRLSSILLALIVLFAACRDTVVVEQRNAEGIIVDRYERSKDDSLIQGIRERFEEDGTLYEEAVYNKGKLDGKRKLYYPSGELHYEQNLANDKFHGPYKSFFPDGTLEVEGQYEDDVMVGVWTYYYPSGDKKEAVTFADNEENGPFTEWYSNGALKAEGHYLGGDKEHGELLLYNLNGVIEKRMRCEHGICRTMWKLNKNADDTE